jgi:anti-sigma factor RsiW
MDCLSDEILRAYLDHELEPTATTEINNHLAACPVCRARSESLSATALRVNAHLSILELPASATEANPQIALARFKANLPANEPRQPFAPRMFAKRWRFAWAASLAVALLVISLLFPAGRSFAQRLLATLRVEKVQTVALDLPAMNDSKFDRNVQQALSQMISKNVVVTVDEKPQPASSQEQASALANFPVRLLSVRTDAPQLHVEGAHAFHMTIDRSRLQDVLDQAGRPDLLLPATLEGATISVQIPRSVAAAYGSCPNHNGNNESTGQQEDMSDKDCVILLQAPSPVVNVPSDLNLQQLAEIALQFAGMSDVQARKFCQTIDWKSTLVLPVPPSIRSYETVDVNGVQGTLLKCSGHRGTPAYVLIWVKNGVIYSIVNSSGDANSAVQLASSLE